MAEQTYSAQVIARLLLLTVQRVGQLAQQGIIPRDEHNKYQIAPAVQGYVRFLKSGQDGPGEEAAKSKGRLLKARARAAEMEADMLERNSLARVDVERGWNAVLEMIRRRMLAVPSSVSASAFAAASIAEVNALITAAVHDALEDASRPPVYDAVPRAAPDRVDNPDDDGDAEASAEPDGFAVGRSVPAPIA